MAFTFGDDLTVARDFVRFYSGDTVSPGFMSDALITSLIAVEGSNNAAIVAGLEYICSQLARPDFRADWLQVSNAEALKGYERRLATARRKYGVTSLTASATMTYRHDSDQDSDADYDGDGSADN